MGSLTSRPKAPKPVTQVVYYNTESQTDSTSTTGANSEEVAAARAENVLRRNRGIFGNVLTGFRGILSRGDASPQRKILLGE